MPTRIGDILGQGGDSDTYKLVKGKDVDLTNADAMGEALADADLILIDDAAAGTQASTKKATLSQLLTYVQANNESFTHYHRTSLFRHISPHDIHFLKLILILPQIFFFYVLTSIKSYLYIRLSFHGDLQTQSNSHYTSFIYFF